jgi:hypothetical protein
MADTSNVVDLNANINSEYVTLLENDFDQVVKSNRITAATNLTYQKVIQGLTEHIALRDKEIAELKADIIDLEAKVEMYEGSPQFEDTPDDIEDEVHTEDEGVDEHASGT